MFESFSGVIAFAFMSSLLVVATVLRAKIRFLQTALVPASLIAGTIGFTLLAADLSFGYTSSDFTAFTFHCFTLSFMSLCLTGSPAGAKGNTVVAGGSWLSAVWVSSLVMQALIGLGVVLTYNALTGNSLSTFLGMIATHGFTQGPGQAIALGNIWETELGIEHAVSFGLIYASIGFVVAFVFGVPVAKWAITKGLNFNQKARIDEDFLSGVHSVESRPEAGRQVTHSANVDSLAFHIAILGIAYFITHQYLLWIAPLAQTWVLGDIHFGILFSHNLFFLHGLMVCVLMRLLIDRLGYGHFIDNDTQRRITGSSVDFMVVATMMSIQFGLLITFLVPIVLVCVAVSLGTALMCFLLGRQLQHLGIERALTIFGCCCGSTGTGLLLLRIVDPDFSTPIAKELAFFNIAILIAGFHILTLMAPILPSYDISTIVSVYAATLIAGGIIALLIGRRVPAHTA